MTIRPGEPWGHETPRPPALVVVDSDAAASRAGLDARRPVGLGGGDLHRSLGAPGPRDPVLRIDVDGIAVELDGTERFRAVAHVVVRRSWWRGAIVAVMNVDQLGSWNVAPRAHPNDGILDVVEVSPAMSPRERWEAWRRLPTGTHVPHPSISTARVSDRTWRFDAPHDIWVDGARVGTATMLRAQVEVDRFTFYV